MENSQFSQNEDPNRKTDQIYELIREFLPDVRLFTYNIYKSYFIDRK